MTITLEQYEDALTVLSTRKNAASPATVHATKLHMVYGVPISDAVKTFGTGSIAETSNRNNVYSFAASVTKIINLIEAGEL